MSVDMQIIVANFDTEDGAKDALKAVKHEKVNRGDVAILSKNDKGKIRVEETDDWGGGKGDVTAIVLQGAYDKPTPIYVGRRAARELENSTYILIPQAGHGTWKQADDCVGQIATAFVQDPGAELDLSCLDARRPQWALPGDGES